MKRGLLLLLLFLGLITAAGVWFLNESGDAEVAGVGSGIPAAASRPSGLVTGENRILSGEHLPEQARSAIPAATESTDTERGDWIARGSWIDVQVEIPPGTPTDETVEVWLVAEDGGNLSGSLQWMLGSSDAMVLDAGALLREVAEKPTEYFAAHLTCDAEGRARLPYPKVAEDAGKTAPAHLVLTGRYLYLLSAVEVDRAQVGRTMVLRPRLGAWIRGRLRLPAAAAERGFDPDSLAGKISLQSLGVMQEGGGMSFLSRSDPIEAGRFEIRGLPPEVTSRLTPQVKGLLGVNRKLEALAAGEAREIELELQVGGRIRGCVGGSDGEIIAGAGVTFHGQVGRRFGTEAQVFRTGEDGRFELTGVPAGEVRVTAKAKGWRNVEMFLNKGLTGR
jgi:hypothetical protein